MFDLFAPAAPILPEWLLQLNLLRAFIYYITAVLAASVLLRARFYYAVFTLAKHVSQSCPRIFELVRDHWLLCIEDGLLARFGAYALIMSVYSLLNNFVYPESSVSVQQLLQLHPAVLVFHLVLIGWMMAVDFILLARISVIDADRIIRDLTFAEGWLGGNINHLLDRWLGTYNPLMRYARRVAQDNIVWLKDVFRSSLDLMVTQLVLRLVAAFSLFVSMILSQAA
ncbi:MAG: hypothetical protein ACRC1K_11960 [Planctomycetia bacterium]